MVEGKEFGYTESHQVAVNVKEYGGGSMISTLLEQNDIILNMNMLPHEPLRNHNNPEGLRIGVAEMTRFGMNEPEMEKIAGLIKEIVIDKKNVKDEVNKLRAGYQEVKYSFDNTEA
jgi:glycine hydroxymethyltransferase